MRQFNVLLMGSILGAMALLLIGAVFIDPQGAFHGQVIKGVNDAKPEINREERGARALALRNTCPEAAVFGSSKVLHGIPAQELFAGEVADGHALNLGLGSPSIFEIRDYVKFAHSRTGCRLQRVLVGLDFFMFNSRPSREDARFDESIPKTAELLQRLALSREALSDSVATVVSSAQGKAALREPDWSMTDRHYAEKLRAYGGHRGLFEDEVKALFGYFPPPDYKFSFAQRDGVSAFQALEEILEYADRNRIRVDLAIPPVHAFELTGIHQLRLWPEFEEFKRQATLAAAKFRDRNVFQIGGCSGIMDFAYAHEVAREPIPVAGIDERMEFWWESTHFKRSLGRLVISELRTDTGTGKASRSIGRCLTPASLAAIEAADREALRVYVEGNPGESERVAKILRQGMPKRFMTTSGRP